MTQPQLRIICTGRGKHPSRELGVLLLPEEQPSGPVNPDDFADPDEAKNLVSGPGTGLSLHFRRNRRGERVQQDAIRFNVIRDAPLRFMCSSCGRDVPMTRENARALLVSATEAGLKSFDVSAM